MSHDPNDPYGGPPQGGPPSSDDARGGFPQGPQQGGYGQQQGYGQQGGYGQQDGHGGYGGPPGGPPYGGQPPGSGQPPTQGWKIAAIVLLIIGPILSAIGLVPCLGIVNWLAIPTNVALGVVGTLGLTIGPKGPDGRAADFPIHLAAVIVGSLLAIASIVRCTLGSGIV